MMRAALRRGGRLVVVTVLGAALTAGTAGAEEVSDPPPAEVTHTIAPEAVAVNECKIVTLVRDASVNYSLGTSRTGTEMATGTVHGDGMVEVCVNLQVTGGGAVAVAVQATADADATAIAEALENPEAPGVDDNERACFKAGVDLAAAGSGSTNAKGTVSIKVSGNAAAGADTTSADGVANGAGTAHVLAHDVDETVEDEDGTREFASSGVCVDSSGNLTDP